MIRAPLLLNMLLLPSQLASDSSGFRFDQPLPDRVLHAGLTTPKFKLDLLFLFNSTEWSRASVLEIGAGGGYTTVVLSRVFGLVLACEKYWARQPQLTSLEDEGMSNVVRLRLDSGEPHAFDFLAGQNVSAGVIDGDHHAQYVLRDTFSLLRSIPCCVRTLVYHDYCDAVVYRIVQYFVDAELIEYQGPVGELNWNRWWCHDSRPEGAAFRVLRDSPDFEKRLNTLHKAFARQASPDFAIDRLNGTEWLLVGEYPLAFLALRFWPGTCSLQLLKSALRDDTALLARKLLQRSIRLGPVHLLDSSDDPNPEGSRNQLAEIRAPGKSGVRFAALTFEQEFYGVHLAIDKESPLFNILPPSIIGLHHAYSKSCAVRLQQALE